MKTPNEITGNLFDIARYGDTIVIPTNGIVKHSGCLVMGSGLAKEALIRYPRLDLILGMGVRTGGNYPQLHPFGDVRILSFPTKDDWKDPATLDLIERSATVAAYILTLNRYRTPRESRLLMPRVGTGLGGLSWDSVKPILERCLSGIDTLYIKR